jgi:small subunit ribosomal protein S5
MAENDTKNTNPEIKQDFKKNTTKVRPQRRREDNKGGKKEDNGFDEKIIDIKRVTRMFKGGRRMRLSVFVVVGDRKGKVGLGIGKGSDVRAAQAKAVARAKKNLVSIPLTSNTIPHDVKHKEGAALVLIKPAAPGTGIVAGSSMRIVAEVAGIKDMLGKILGTNNKIANAYATVNALTSLRATRL